MEKGGWKITGGGYGKSKLEEINEENLRGKQEEW